jgi:hypothetical protein
MLLSQRGGGGRVMILRGYHEDFSIVFFYIIFYPINCLWNAAI